MDSRFATEELPLQTEELITSLVHRCEEARDILFCLRADLNSAQAAPNTERTIRELDGLLSNGLKLDWREVRSQLVES